MSGSVRWQACEACWRNCRYADFRGSVPTRPGARGAGPWGTFAEEGSYQQARLTEAIAAGKTDMGVSRGTIVGALHAGKQAMWDRETLRCYYRGQDLPRTTDQALEMVSRVSATAFRVSHLGMTVKGARAIRRSVTVDEFLAWWRVVGAQQRLDVYVGGEDLAGVLDELG